MKSRGIDGCACLLSGFLQKSHAQYRFAFYNYLRVGGSFQKYLRGIPVVIVPDRGRTIRGGRGTAGRKRFGRPGLDGGGTVAAVFAARERRGWRIALKFTVKPVDSYPLGGVCNELFGHRSGAVFGRQPFRGETAVLFLLCKPVNNEW